MNFDRDHGITQLEGVLTIVYIRQSTQVFASIWERAVVYGCRGRTTGEDYLLMANEMLARRENI